MNDITKEILKRLEDVGKGRQILHDILENDIFEHLNKHNPLWHSEHESEYTRFYEIRMKIMALEEALYDLREVLEYDWE